MAVTLYIVGVLIISIGALAGFMKDNIAFVRLAYFDIQFTFEGGQIVLSYK